MKYNIAKHELIGLILIFLGATSLGIGLYISFWGAVRPLFYGSTEYLIRNKELLLFPLFYGGGALLLTLGVIELKEMRPGRKKW